MNITINKKINESNKNVFNPVKLLYIICLMTSFVGIAHLVNSTNTHLNLNLNKSDEVFSANLLQILSIIVFAYALISLNGLNLNNKIKITILVIWLLYIVSFLLIETQTKNFYKVMGVDISYAYIILNFTYVSLIFFTIIMNKKNLKYIIIQLCYMNLIMFVASFLPLLSKFMAAENIINIFSILKKFINIVILTLALSIFFTLILLTILISKRINNKLSIFQAKPKFIFIFELLSTSLLSFFIFEFDLNLNINIFSYLSLTIGALLILWTILYFSYLYKKHDIYFFGYVFKTLFLIGICINIYYSSINPLLKINSKEIIFICAPMCLSLCIASASNLSHNDDRISIFAHMTQFLLIIIFILFSINIRNEINKVQFMKNFINIDLLLYLIIFSIIWISTMKPIFFAIKNGNIKKIMKWGGKNARNR